MPPRSARSHNRSPPPEDVLLPLDVDEQPEQPEPLEDPPEVLDALEQSLKLPDNPFDDKSTPNLAQAIMLMSQELRRRKNAPSSCSIGKVKEPDTFDGSNDESKVTFALSFLRGIALEYFEPSILDSDETPSWIDNWSAFIWTLRTQFNPIDPTADTEDGIDNLKMQENQCIVKYNVEFTHLAIQTGWDDSILHHHYYSSLAERIKDIMGQQGKLATLEAMKALTHSIDSHHYERLCKKSNNNSGNSKNKNKPNQNSNNNNTGKPASSGNSAALSDKLGKDGKLTPQERQCRFDNNLCMFCGRTGHTAKDCLKSSSSASKTKAHATQAKEKDKESPDSKKA